MGDNGRRGRLCRADGVVMEMTGSGRAGGHLASARRELRGGQSGGGAASVAVVALLGVSHEVILAAEALLTKWTREVARARVHHQMSFNVFSREEHTLALITLEAPLGRRPLGCPHFCHHFE